MTDIRVSQDAIDVLVAPAPSIALSQLSIDVLYPSTPGTSPIRVSGVELESVQQYSAVPARLSQVGLESVQKYTAVPVRVSSVNLESVQQYSAVPVRVSQVGVEVLYSDDGVCYFPEEEVPPTVTTFPIRRLRRAPHISQSMDYVYYESLELDLERGVGLQTGEAHETEPHILLRWSDDGGHTWSNEQRANVGAIGAYSTRAIWRRLGRSRDRVFEIVMASPVKWTIVGARLDVTKGTN